MEGSIEMRNTLGEKITYAAVLIILDSHSKWLADYTTGERAVLKGFNLSGMDLSGKDLRHIDLSDSNLCETSFKGSDLSHAMLTCANLYCANLIGANLDNANMKTANLTRAFLNEAKITNADLCGADLKHVYLNKVIIKNTDLTYIKISDQLDSNVITLQINTSYHNAHITYWVDFDIVTTGCFQGTLTELKNRVIEYYEEDEKMLKRYKKTIKYLKFMAEDYKQKVN